MVAELDEPEIQRRRKSRCVRQAGRIRHATFQICSRQAGVQIAAEALERTQSNLCAEGLPAHIFGLGDGKLLAVYIQNADSGAELVSEVLSCSVKN
jgi:hypothetical protein